MNENHCWHVVLTKYNAPLSSVGMRPDRRGIDVAWLQARFALFSRWTVASMRNQDRPPDQWLIFVDAATPSAERNDLLQLTRGIAELVDVYEPLIDDRIQREVAARIPASARTLLTSRLDNDDAVSLDYCQLMRRQVTIGWRGFVNPCTGIQLAGDVVLRRWDPSSPFLSYIEDLSRADGPRTVMSVEHHRARHAGDLRQLRGRPAWLQVIHEHNLANAADGMPVSFRELAAFAPYAADLSDVRGWSVTDAGLAGRAMTAQARRALFDMWNRR